MTCKVNFYIVTQYLRRIIGQLETQSSNDAKVVIQCIFNISDVTQTIEITTVTILQIINGTHLYWVSFIQQEMHADRIQKPIATAIIVVEHSLIKIPVQAI